MKLNKIEIPTVIIDENKCRLNINRMHKKASDSGVLLRPHFKTHQSLKVGSWYRDKGIKSITVSSVSMAEYFASDGWDDILIAFPVNFREIDRIRSLSKKIDLIICIPSKDSARLFADICDFKINVVIKIDTGYGRSGTLWNDKSQLKEIPDILNSNKNINLLGLISHSGDSYNAANRGEIKDIYYRSVEKINKAKEYCNVAKLTISVGDTPTASIIEKFSGIDESRAGNFIFYDLMQYRLGACSIEDIATAVACPIVDIDRLAGKAVIYGGAVHFSKEYLEIDGKKVYGQLVKATGSGWEEMDNNIYLSSISQEHGIIKLNDSVDFDYKIGDLVYILPVHSCLTADAIAAYLSTEGEIIDHLRGCN